MAKKPSSLPEWASDGTQITEPTEGIKDRGWNVQEKPPAQFLNWLFNLLYQWTQYLDEPDQMTFGAGEISAGEENAALPRVTFEPNADATYTRCINFGGSVALWVNDGGNTFALTVNVLFTTTSKWQKINNTLPAFILKVTPDRIQIGSMPEGQDTDWTDAFVEGVGTASGWGRILDIPTDGAADTPALASIARAALRMTEKEGVDRVLLWELTRAGFNHQVRAYYVIDNNNHETPALEIVLNAKYTNDAQSWVREDLTTYCVRFYLSLTAFRFQWSLDPREDSDWVDVFAFPFQPASGWANILTLRNGSVTVVATESEDADDANPPAQSAQTNRIGVRNTDKVTAYIQTGATTQVLSGYNLASSNPVTYKEITPLTGSAVELNFGAEMEDENYECVVTCEGALSQPYFAQIAAKNKGGVTIGVYTISLATHQISPVDLSSTAVRLNVRISGVQKT